MTVNIGDTTTVNVDGEFITGRVYHVRDNGWPCVQTNAGRIASGPRMTLEEASEYTYQADEAEGEHRAEYGSGAVSLGYNGSEAMLHYDGYRTSDDEEYAEAKRVIREVGPLVRMFTIDTRFIAPIDTTDDIPF